MKHDETDVKVFYVRGDDKFPVACVASRFVTMGDGVTYVVFSWSKWNPEDQFNREVGRSYAVSRLLRGKWAGIVPVKEGRTKNRILMTLALNHTAIPTPHSLQRAAEKMLLRRLEESRQRYLRVAAPRLKDVPPVLRSMPEVLQALLSAGLTGRISSKVPNLESVPTFALPKGCRDTTEKVELKSQPKRHPKETTHD